MYIKKGKLKLGCKKTPERGSYYCLQHLKNKEKQAFRFNDSTIYIDPEEIKITRGKIQNNNLVIHDAYVDRHDNVLLLVNYPGQMKDKNNFFWISNKQLAASKIEKYINQLKELLNLKSINNITCNSTKIYTLPCPKKARTVGIFLAVNNCGIIGSYKVIFYTL